MEILQQGKARKLSVYGLPSFDSFRALSGRQKMNPSPLYSKKLQQCVCFLLFLKQAIKLSKLKTKREVVQEALKSYVASMKKRELLDLKGRITWEGNLKEMRSL